MGLDAEGEGGVGALERQGGGVRGAFAGNGEERSEEACHLCGAAEVVVINFLYGLEVNNTLQLGLVFV